MHVYCTQVAKAGIEGKKQLDLQIGVLEVWLVWKPNGDYAVYLTPRSCNSASVRYTKESPFRGASCTAELLKSTCETPQCKIHHGVAIPRLSKHFIDYLHKSSAKIEIVPEYL